MKKTFCAILAAAMTMAMTGCTGKKATHDTADIVADTTAVADTTVYGTCGDGSTMHVLQLVTDRGDTLECMLESPDGTVETEVKGGMSAGDRMGVILTLDNEGQQYACSAINITSLLGRWSSLEQSFQLNADGSVTNSVKEPRPYTRWQLCNGRLVLSADTFSIETIGSDSLYLKDSRGVAGYRRM